MPLTSRPGWYGGELPAQSDDFRWIQISNGNFFTGLYKKIFWFQAKIYSEGSEYGINDGRISKLVVCDYKDLPMHQRGQFHHEKKIYNYDRGIDVDHPIGEEIASLFV